MPFTPGPAVTSIRATGRRSSRGSRRSSRRPGVRRSRPWPSAIFSTLRGSAGASVSHGLTFLGLLGGGRSPGWHQHAKGAIHGLTFETPPLDIRQAALEGVAFMFATVADLMPEVEEVVATGGSLLKDGDWLQ